MLSGISEGTGILQINLLGAIMQSIKDRVGAVVTAASVAAAALAGGGGLLAPQSAHAEPGWRLCMAAATSNESDVSAISTLIKYRAKSNPNACNFFRSTLNSRLDGVIKQNYLTAVRWNRQYYSGADCQSNLETKIGSPPGKDVCNSMSSGQTQWDIYVAASGLDRGGYHWEMDSQSFLSSLSSIFGN